MVLSLPLHDSLNFTTSLSKAADRFEKGREVFMACLNQLKHFFCFFVVVVVIVVYLYHLYPILVYHGQAVKNYIIYFEYK